MIETNLLIIIMILVSVSILVYIDPAYAQGSEINLDPEQSPSYASFEQQIFINPNSVFVVIPIQLGIISLILVTAHLILKKKNQER